jgi:hypothetical protein
MYADVSKASATICKWYWTSIKTKRKTSLTIRALAFVGLAGGTALPIFAALCHEDVDKLRLTQGAVALLAISGLMVVADRVFGWSTGWMRYITTVTTMENLTRAFQLEWGRFLIARSAGAPLDTADAKALYELSAGLEQELIKLQAEETTKWCAEFNTGISLLETMIKTQREETDKKLDAIRTSLSTQQKAAQAGAIEATLIHKADPKKVHVSLDNEPPEEFLGTVWSRMEVAPGIHKVRVQTLDNPPTSVERVVTVEPSRLATLEIKLG